MSLDGPMYSPIEYSPTEPFNKLPLLPPDIQFGIPVYQQLTRAARALAELKGAEMIVPNASILIGALALQEAKLSSEIENIFTTNDELYQAMLDNNPKPATKEVLNYSRALWYGYEQLKSGGRPLATRLFEEIATQVKGVETTVRKVPGTHIQDQRRKVIYTPPSGEAHLRSLLHNLETYLHDQSTDTDPLLKMAVAHYQFEAIHPFPDGNGRTGRIINMLYLVDAGLLGKPVLYLSRFIIENKSEYYRLLREVTQQQAWEPWVLYMLKAVEDSSKQASQTLEGIKNLMEQTTQVTKAGKPKIYSKDLIEAVFIQPVTKVKYIMEALDMGRHTATKYLRALVELGVLEEKAVGRDNLYINRAFLELLS